MSPRVNKWLDLLDRAGWTAIQTAAATATAAWTGAVPLSLREGFYLVAVATGLAVVKVIAGQNTGTDESGSLVGKPVIEPPPEA